MNSKKMRKLATVIFAICTFCLLLQIANAELDDEKYDKLEDLRLMDTSFNYIAGKYFVGDIETTLAYRLVHHNLYTAYKKRREILATETESPRYEEAYFKILPFINEVMKIIQAIPNANVRKELSKNVEPIVRVFSSKLEVTPIE